MRRAILVLFFILGLVGCGSTSNTSPTASKDNTVANNSQVTNQQAAQPKAVAATTDQMTGGDPVEVIKNLIHTKLGNRIVIENVGTNPNGVGINITFTYLEKDNHKIQQELLDLIRDLGKTKVSLSSITLSEISPTSKKPVGSISFIRKQISNLATADDATILKQADTKFFDITRE
jgi:hypothetical protein